MSAGWAAVLVSALVLAAGALGVVVRLSMRWEQMESDLRHLVEDSRADRAATDKRLRWLEEHLWNRDGRRLPAGVLGRQRESAGEVGRMGLAEGGAGAWLVPDGPAAFFEGEQAGGLRVAES